MSKNTGKGEKGVTASSTRDGLWGTVKSRETDNVCAAPCEGCGGPGVTAPHGQRSWRGSRRSAGRGRGGGHGAARAEVTTRPGAPALQPDSPPGSSPGSSPASASWWPCDLRAERHCLGCETNELPRRAGPAGEQGAPGAASPAGTRPRARPARAPRSARQVPRCCPPRPPST